MNNLLLGWMIISSIVVIVWVILLLMKKLRINIRAHTKEIKDVHTGTPSYSKPDYMRRPSAVEYYGVYSPTRAGVPADSVKGLDSNTIEHELPHCPECGTAIGYLSKKCPKCGLILSTK